MLAYGSGRWAVTVTTDLCIIVCLCLCACHHVTKKRRALGTRMGQSGKYVGENKGMDWVLCPWGREYWRHCRNFRRNRKGEFKILVFILACEPQTYFRSFLSPSRRERSDDRKYVCSSPAIFVYDHAQTNCIQTVIKFPSIKWIQVIWGRYQDRIFHWEAPEPGDFCLVKFPHPLGPTREGSPWHVHYSFPPSSVIGNTWLIRIGVNVNASPNVTTIVACTKF